jgi:hypothetical protein
MTISMVTPRITEFVHSGIGTLVLYCTLVPFCTVVLGLAAVDVVGEVAELAVGD